MNGIGWPRQQVNGRDRFGMVGRDRLLLYRTAIESGSAIQRASWPNPRKLGARAQAAIRRARAATTQNHKEAQQFIAFRPRRSTTDRTLRTKARPCPGVQFAGSDRYGGNATRGPLAAARGTWLRECLGDLDAYIAREQSDFLAVMNHDGEVLDFHSLRHTCGAWLAMTGEQPKVVQIVMRHSSVTLTLDTYGHLWARPGGRGRSEARNDYGTGSLNGLRPQEPMIRSRKRAAPGAAVRVRISAWLVRLSAMKRRRPTLYRVQKNTLKSAARCEPVPSSTISCYPIASLSSIGRAIDS